MVGVVLLLLNAAFNSRSKKEAAKRRQVNIYRGCKSTTFRMRVLNIIYTGMVYLYLKWIN